jgi:6-phosphogluconolactonase
MNTSITEGRYPDADSLAVTLADDIAAALAAAITTRTRASLVVSGGRSPVKLFECLRRATIDWRRVSVALADERWVDPADAASNERLVREHLLKDGASAAHFVGLKNAAATPDLGAAAAWHSLAGVARPFDIVVLGMGDDGHTASLFPDSPNLGRALEEPAAGYIGMEAPTAPRARMSLNLSALLDSRRIVILISGDSKWQTYLAAAASGPVTEMPVRAVLRQERTPVEVIWCP